MHRSDDIWSSLVDSGMDYISSWVDGMHVASFLDHTFFVNQAEVVLYAC